MILSILIPTIKERFEMLSKLTAELYGQKTYIETVHPSLSKVEILIDDSPKFLDGGPSIGKKREALVRKSTGNYVCFLDDDESIAPNYLETLVRLCTSGRDVCTFRSIAKLENYWMIVNMGLHYPNDQASPMFMIRRRPWHVCPVKREHAMLYDFEDSNYGEDFTWMERVLTHCTTEAKTEAVIHQYNHGKHSEADKIMKYV